MNKTSEHAPILVFTFGNPSRGDDALGSAMFDLLEEYQVDNKKNCNFDLLTDYQLQIEHTVDLENREGILFIDASVSCSTPYEFYKLNPDRDESYTTHAMSPSALLSVYQQVNQKQPPESYMLMIRGYEFTLGEPITEHARINLEPSLGLVIQLLETRVENWPQKHII